MQQYLSLLQEILDKGEQRQDRTGVGFSPKLNFIYERP